MSNCFSSCKPRNYFVTTIITSLRFVGKRWSVEASTTFGNGPRGCQWYGIPCRDAFRTSGKETLFSMFIKGAYDIAAYTVH